jgi:hypothetical protein
MFSEHRADQSGYAFALDQQATSTRVVTNTGDTLLISIP